MEEPSGSRSSAKWQPFKDLLEATERLALNRPSSLQPLKILLRRHKPDFLSLLKNQAKSPESKAEIKKHIGLSVQGNLKVIDEAFVNEALIVSDLFELNEVIAFDLLLTGEQQKPNYTSYSRGLVAVMLYWDGKRNLASALRTLIQCRKGKSWTLELLDEAASLATSFTDELLHNGLTQQILKLLENIQVESELDKLAKQKGLGNARHRRQVRDLIVEVRQTLADCLFNFAGQSGLPKDDVIVIIDYLRQHAEVESDGKLSSVTTSVLFALFYAIKSPIDLNVDEEGEELLKQSIIFEEDFLVPVHKVFMDEESTWKVPGLRACALLAWSLALRSVSQSALSSSFNLAMSDVLEQDEIVLENALVDKVFFFLKENIVSSENFHKEEFYQRLIHLLITDLIINMPLKIKEMRNHGDEVARILMLHLVEGEEAPSDIRKDFQHLMELITAVYDKDPLRLELSSDFWSFADQSYPADGSRVAGRRVSQKQAALFKFVRQSGDILPPLLYIPYIHMLSALATGTRSARAAFELLRANGGNGDGLISWDHFFLSCHRYFESLRRDKVQYDVANPFAALQTSNVSIGVNAKPCAITPQEVEGLRAVMKLAAKIAQFDDIACLTFYEDGHWCVCGVLFGLLLCPLPVQLKGDILQVLAQLSRLSAIAPGILQACDQAQVLKGQPGVDKLGHIATELEELEARDEEYPMSKGFLKLLTVLTDMRVDSLGECFQQYVAFAVESLYLRSLTRAYAQPEEKWLVAGQCLELFNKILLQYQPSPDDFFDEKSFAKSQDDSALFQAKSSLKHPGMSLLCHVYNEGNFFQTIMQIVCSCIAYFDTYVTKSALEHTLVDATEQSLQLLLRGMQLQDQFLEVLRNSGSSMMITPLDKLLLGINPITGKADYVITLAWFVQHSNNYPCISLLAIEILSWLCSSSAHRHIVTLVINSCNEKKRLRLVHGFVDILDTAASEDSEGTNPNLVAQQREAILRMMIQCVDQPSPNFTQILLGFDPMQPPSRGSLQDPGVLGASRSCLHAVLAILSTEEEQPTAICDAPKLAELCFHLIYRLSANLETSEPILRYLRSSCDFIFKHLQHLPFRTDELCNLLLMQHSWLLKTAAVELHVLASKQQRTNVQRLIQVLLNKPVVNETTSLIGQTLNQSDRSRLADVSSLHSTSIVNSTINPTPSKLTMLDLFDLIDFNQEYPPPLTLDQFVLSLVEEGIRSCERTNEHGVVFCDIKILHNLLESSVNTLATEDVNRKRLASQDVQNILSTVVQRNQVRASVHAKLHFLTSWKQVLEIMMTSCPDDVLMKATRNQVVFAVLQHLVTAGRHVNAAQDLTSALAPVVLTLAMQIRSSVTSGKSDGSFSSSEDLPQDTINLLLTFQVVIQAVIEWLLQSGVNQKSRVSLYAAFLHYMQLCQQTKAIGADPEEYTRLQSIRTSVYTRLMTENVRMLRDFGDSFKALLCKDAFTGHSICRVLAFGCLDSILQIDNEQLWLQYMINNGYIGNMANSFAEEDEALQEYLHPAFQPSRAVYIFEQKMALLCSIVHTPGGARAIISSQILPELAKCDFLEMRPQSDYAEDPASVTALARYRQLLFPVLQLCVSLLNALGGSTHHECCAVVLQFLLSHAQPIVTAVLRSNAHDHQSLTELQLVTGILSQVAGQDFTNSSLYPDIPQAILMEIQGSLFRIQRQLTNLLPQFLLTDEVLNNLKSKVEDQKEFEKTSLLLHEIASNLLTYCRVVVTRSADAESAVLFASELADSSYGNPVYGNEISRKPSMGILLKFLRTSLSRYTSESDKLKQWRAKLDNIDQLNSLELKEILGPNVDAVQLTVTQEQNLAVTKLNQSIAIKAKLCKCLLYILETSLYLLWHHLSLYVSQAVSVGKTKKKLLFPHKTNTPVRNSPRRLQDISNSVAPDNTPPAFQLPAVNINQLKSDVQSCVTDSFLKKLSAVESEGSFVQPLVRRLQRVKLQLN